MFLDLFEQAQPLQYASGIGRDLDTRADLTSSIEVGAAKGLTAYRSNSGGLLQNDHFQAIATTRDGAGEASETSADDDHLEHHNRG